MTYKEVWEEQKSWLKNSMTYLNEQIAKTNGKEKKRLESKLDGMNMAYQHMIESDKMYQFNDK
ncbi:hypothetical protein [Bacillus thuringiensis]|uniref:hypothetical protein n=1 Tax=Bacillus thuringiensis TaxID=1428 RepID=UPI0011A6BF96|nr:hypothetical protein [Bacillus thuringiensis]